MATNLDTLAGINSDIARNQAGAFDPQQTFGFKPDPTLSTTPIDQSSTPNQIEPFVPNLPKYRTAAINKWTTLLPVAQQQGISDTNVQDVVKMDQQRVASGSPPLDMATSVAALKSAKAGHPLTTPKPSAGNVLGNIGSDFENIAGSLLHLPQTVYNAAKDIPHISREFSKAAATPGDIGKKLGAILQHTDVLNLIPGSHTLGDLASRNFEDIGLHPLSTALDVLPAAGLAAENISPAGSLADELRTEGGTTAAPRPLKASVLFKVAQVPELDDAGNPTGGTRPTLVRNPIGEQVYKIANESGIGAGLTERFGSTIRNNVSTPLNRLSAGINQVLTGKPPPSWIDDDIAEAAAASAKLNEEHDMSPQDVNDAAKLGVEFNPSDPQTRAYLDANPKMERYLRDARELTNVYAAHISSPIEDMLNARGQLDKNNPSLLAQYKGEVYTPEQAQKLASSERGATRAEQALLYSKNSNSVINRLTAIGSEPGADPRILDVAQQLQDGDYQGARTQFSQLSARKVGLGASETRAVGSGTNPNELEFPLPGGQVQIREAGNISRALDKAVSMRKTADDLGNATAPATFGDWIVRKTGENLEARIAPGMTNPGDVEMLHKLITARDYQPLIDDGTITQQMWDAESREVAKSWKTMQDAGMDPVFLHHIQAPSVAGMMWPRVLPQETELSQAQERTWQPQPYIPDYGLALTHQGMELMRRQGQELAIDDIVRTSGVKESDLKARYATRIAKMGERVPELGSSGASNAVLGKGWGQFDPESLVGYRPARWADLTGGDRVWLPKPVLKALEDMRTPPSDNLLTKVTDPVMGPFRASVLNLSPRFMANTVLGGALETGAGDPRGVLHMYQAAKLLNGSDEFTLTKNRFNPFKETETYTFAKPDEFNEILNMAKREREQLSDLNTRAGSTMGRWFKAAQDSKVGSVGMKAFDAPLNVHNFFGNMYRSMALIGGTDEALSAGMSPEIAVKEGLRLTSRILPQWDSLTPFERGIVRSVFPFYTWSQHILSFVYNLPLDHPTRVGVVNSLARTAVQDEQSGWPQLFRSMLLLGHPDASGNQESLKLNGGNPFTDVSSLWSLQGFLKGVNPEIETGLNALGIKEGQPELYANTNYNPETGKLEVDTGNPLLNLLHNTVPQSDWIASLLGVNEDYESELKSNPEAAHQRLLSDVGLPQFFGKVNVANSAARQEITAYKAMLTNQSVGLKAGNKNTVEQYPESKPYIDKLLTKSPKQLQPFNPSATPGPSPAQQTQIAALSPHPL